MSVEFATSINDYRFSKISDKMLVSLKESMTNTLLFERVDVLKPLKGKEIIHNQTYWVLI